MTGDSGGNKQPAGRNKKMASFQRDDASFIFNFCQANLWEPNYNLYLVIRISEQYYKLQNCWSFIFGK